MKLEYYPYGNAKEYKNGTSYYWTCQHGTSECVGNLYETCAISLLVDQAIWYPLIYCMESGDPSKNGASCAKKLGIDWTPIANCYNSSQGNELEHEMAVATNSLNPPHTYVPWIVIDGVHTESLQTACQDDLLRVVCSKYTGTKPAGCKKYLHEPTPIALN